jgi:hypothetical protein
MDTNPLNANVPRHLQQRLLWLPDHSRNMGIHLLAGRGSGKSRLMGRVIGWQDFIRGVPLIILDPAGPTIDNLLDKLTRLPATTQTQLWPRIVYVDMSGQGERIVPFPLLYRLGNESSFAVSQRYLDTVRSVDPYLVTASVQGWNALWRIGTYAGMILSALGFQLTEAEDLLRNPEAWEPRFSHALALHPDLMPAVAFFTTEYLSMSKRDRDAFVSSYLTKITLFSLDPTLRAMFGADTPGINWSKVVRKRQAVLFDFRHVHDVEQRRFKMLWVFYYLMSFIKYRGAGRHRPISLIVDELAALTHLQAGGESVFATVLDELINVYARNCMIWLCLAHQELFQLEERIQKSLMSLGTQIIGVTSDMNAALALAKQLVPIDPYKIKRYEPVYSNYMGQSTVIDERPVEFTLPEQQYLASYQFTRKRLFEFLVRPAAAEGDIATTLSAMSIKNLDKGQWVNEALVRQARAMLRQRTGVPIGDILSHIDTRIGRPPAILAPPAYENDLPTTTPTDEDDDWESLRETKRGKD